MNSSLFVSTIYSKVATVLKVGVCTCMYKRVLRRCA